MRMVCSYGTSRLAEEACAGHASPAEAFFAAFGTGTAGVPWPAVPADSATLMGVADAIRSGERAAVQWLLARPGWDASAARGVARALALGAGTWLLAGAAGRDALAEELGRVWRESREAAE